MPVYGRAPGVGGTSIGPPPGSCAYPLLLLVIGRAALATATLREFGLGLLVFAFIALNDATMPVGNAP